MVLAILTLFALIAIPRMASAVLRSRLDAALDSVRGDLQFTRARTVSTGLRHQMQIDAGSGEILVAPFHPEETVSGAAAPGATPDIALQDSLPRDVRVVQWSVSPLGYDTGQAQAGGAGSSQSLVFYAEGRGDSAVLVLEDTHGDRRGLRFDGFTGDIRELQPEEMK